VYGHQDVYRLLGRDPASDPLTPLEQGVFMKMIELHVQHERLERMPTTNPDAMGDDDELAPDASAPAAAEPAAGRFDDEDD
jgi:hypothetical protein